MRNDLISRETAIAEITSWIFTDEDLEGEYDEYQYFNQGLKRAIKALAKVPAVDAEPVRHEGNTTFITTENLGDYADRIIVGQGTACKVYYRDEPDSFFENGNNE